MLILIGLIVAVYAIARLIQVPMEAPVSTNRLATLAVVSVLAGMVIAVLAYYLVLSGLDVPASLRR